MNAENLDNLIEGISQLAYSLLDTQVGVDTASSKEIDSLLFQLQHECTAQGLKGLNYVFRLFQKVVVSRPALPQTPADFDILSEWIADVTTYVLGRMENGQSFCLLERLTQLSWFPPVREDLRNLIRERLAHDANILISFQESQPQLAKDSTSTEVLTEQSPSLFLVNSDTAAANKVEQIAVSESIKENSQLVVNLAEAAFTEPENEVIFVTPEYTEEGDKLNAAEIAYGEETIEEEFTENFTPTDESSISEHTTSVLLDFTEQSNREETENSPHPPEISSPLTPAWITQEELELVIEAVANQLLPSATEVEAQKSVADQLMALANYREQFDLISAAIDALNLPALRVVCSAFGHALDSLTTEDNALREHLHLLGEWPVLLIGHLQAPTDQGAASDLANLMVTPEMSWSLPSESLPALIEQLTNVAIGVNPEIRAARKVLAEPADVELKIPDDVLPNVVAGLLQELPGRSSEFSQRIQRFVQHGQLEDLDTARRIAHTLKGDGNIVGLRGIANLTHALEEILLKLAETPGIPAPELAEVLIESADSLESMSDFVLNRGPLPENSLSVLQQVLDWANALNDGRALPKFTEPVSSLSDIDKPVPVQVATPEEPQPQETTVTVPTINVPTNLLDQLLRLTGEALIYARQVEDRVSRIDQRAIEINSQNKGLDLLVQELQQLVEVRGLVAGSTRQSESAAEEMDILEMEHYNELHTVTQRLVEASEDARTTMGDINEDVVVLRDLLSQQDRIHLDLQNQVLETRTLPVANIVPRLQRVVRQTARQLGKTCNLTIEGENTAVDHEILDRLAEPLLHMLRNSVDHGIESGQERQAIHKPESGSINLSFSRDAAIVRICCRDDGKGLDIDAIRRKGIERGLISPHAEYTTQQLTQLIFQPGFSTRSETTHTSGRGIGMDIVYRSIAQLKGSLTVNSEQGKGCEFEIQLPVSQVVAQVLLVDISHVPVAIVLHGIERTLAIEDTTIQYQNNQAMVEVDGELLPLYWLSNLLNYPLSPQARRATTHEALLIKAPAGRNRNVVLVDKLNEARSAVVKSLGIRVPLFPGVLGATILGDGAIAPVVDIIEIVGMHERNAQGDIISAPVITETPVSTKELPSVLIVDDSLSVRRSLGQLVTDAGLTAILARDGIEAVERVRERRPSLVLVDMEMPRMNGLEFTSFIRKNESTETVPVIMITSRTTERHHDLARAAGVSRILSKPYSEEQLLQLIEQNLTASQQVA